MARTKQSGSGGTSSNNNSSSSMDERASNESKGTLGRVKNEGAAAETHVLVTDDEYEEKGKIELPLEDDGTLSLSTMAHAFAGAFGLKYRNPETGAFRALKIDDQDRVHPPPEGWGNTVYIIIYQKAENTKRKMEDQMDTSSTIKQKRLDQKRCSDLVVLGIPYKTDEEELREYFKQFGEVVVSQVKKDHKTQKSKGFGFVRFADYDSQLKALSMRHSIDGRSVEVKIPNSKEQSSGPQSRKIFVGRVPESMAAEELKTYFEKKGEVTDVYIPRPFRAFAFVTFTDPEVAQGLCGEDHIINGSSVHVSQAVPKHEGGGQMGGGGGGWGSGGGRNYPEKGRYRRSTSPVMSSSKGSNWHQKYEYDQRYMHQSEVWSPSSRMGNDAGSMGGGMVQPYSTSNPWSCYPAGPQMRSGHGGRNTPISYQQSPAEMYPANAGAMAAPPISSAGPYMIPQNGSSTLRDYPQITSGTNQATVGLSNLNLNSLITPQALQAALTSALAGLIPAGGQGSAGAAASAQTTGLDLTALLNSLQTAGGAMAQYVTSSSGPGGWMNQGGPNPPPPMGGGQSQQGGDSSVAAGNRGSGRSWKDDEVTGGSWHRDGM